MNTNTLVLALYVLYALLAVALYVVAGVARNLAPPQAGATAGKPLPPPIDFWKSLLPDPSHSIIVQVLAHRMYAKLTDITIPDVICKTAEDVMANHPADEPREHQPIDLARNAWERAASVTLAQFGKLERYQDVKFMFRAERIAVALHNIAIAMWHYGRTDYAIVLAQAYEIAAGIVDQTVLEAWPRDEVAADAIRAEAAAIAAAALEKGPTGELKEKPALQPLHQAGRVAPAGDTIS